MIKGARVPVAVIVGHIAAGDTIETVMNEYNLAKKQVMAALKYAAKIVGEESVMAA